MFSDPIIQTVKKMIDIDGILKPVSDENPAGEEVRYTGVYDEIKEARRADEVLEMGDWQHELKTSDWDAVIKLSVDALTQKTKDLQIAAWLAEALTKTRGFDGLLEGFKIINGFLTDFWDHLYPEIDDGDLDFRAAPLEFANKNLTLAIQEIPLTDEKVTSGYSWLKWQESRQVGYEESARDAAARQEMIEEGKISAEVFDAAVARSSKEFYAGLSEKISECKEAFRELDSIVDEKFGMDAPRISEIGAAISECERVVSSILKEKREKEPDPVSEEPEEDESSEKAPGRDTQEAQPETLHQPAASIPRPLPEAVPVFSMNRITDSGALEDAIWQDSLRVLDESGLKKALEQLMGASYGATSIREKNRYRLMMARLCLKAERPDLARPIMEELNKLIEDLRLEEWESPVWIGDVLDALYQCLTAGEPSSDDQYRADELLKKLCTIDVTKALKYRLVS